MPRSVSAVELNTFVAGLITEASPLTFPQNASLDEQNFVLNNNGFRSRRLGMNLEAGFVVNGTNTISASNPKFNSFKWKNVGGVASKTFIVLQIGTEVHIFDNGVTPLSAGRIYLKDYGPTYQGQRFSFASVDGFLVVCTGGKNIDTYSYSGTGISLTSKRLLIRDLFGVQDIVNNVDLKVAGNITTRPSTLTSKHVYNLRNQTFAIPHPDFTPDTPTIIDSITNFLNNEARINPALGPTYPSNSDYTTPFIFANTDSGIDKTVPRFNGNSCVSNPLGNSQAPIGYFIIDALDRGPSRIAANQLCQSQFSQNNTYALSDLPADTTPSGATCLAEFAGRVFYAGFTGDLINGDSQSPRMSSYILFSQLIKDVSGINLCYQDGDPTSKDNSTLLDTDGGFIRIQGAFNINSMVNLGNVLIVLAENGVWTVSGGNSYGFTATNYKVTKITDSGCVSPGSSIIVENTLFYWSRDGIFHLAQNQFGDYLSTSVTRTTIQGYFNGIGQIQASNAQGVYDSYEHKIKWMFLDNTNTYTNELVFDLILKAFYKLTISNLGSNIYPRVVKGLQTDPYLVNSSNVEVDVGTDPVYISTGELVTVYNSTISNSVKEVQYLIITGANPLAYTFGAYTQPYHYDWKSYDGVGVDAPSFLLTGVLAGGDYQRKKSIASMTAHFTKTETGFTSDLSGSGDFTPTDSSSCLMQAQWDWTNNAVSNRWTAQQQIYRVNRSYQTSTISDSYNNGYYVVETKNRIRGNGKVLSFLFSSEPGKHLEILGWSCTISTATNV